MKVLEKALADQTGQCAHCGVRRHRRTAFFDAGWGLLCPAREYPACEDRRLAGTSQGPGTDPGEVTA